MRSHLIPGSILSATFLCGCAHSQSPAPTPVTYHDSSAATLVFAPPISFGEPAVVLARGPRQPSVFIGFDELSATAYYIRTDDRQSDDYSDRYHRRAVIEKIGVSYR